MGVYLTGVYLMGVYLTGMHLIGVYLTGVHLMGVHLRCREPLLHSAGLAPREAGPFSSRMKMEAEIGQSRRQPTIDNGRTPFESPSFLSRRRRDYLRLSQAMSMSNLVFPEMS